MSIAKNNTTTHKSNHIRETLGYGVVGLTAAPSIFTDFGLGCRMQDDYIGFDLSLDLTSNFALVTINPYGKKSFNFSNYRSCKFTPSFFIYPHPNLQSEWYTGLGCELGTIYKEDRYFKFFAPVATVGKKYINDAGKNRFIELRITIPSIFTSTWHDLFGPMICCQPIYSPILTIKYGLAF